MIEISGNIFDYGGYWRIVPTNTCFSQKNKCAIMGAGLAKSVRDKYRDIDLRYGHSLSIVGDNLFFDYETLWICFPTKKHWKHKSSLHLIQKYARLLGDIMKNPMWMDETIYLPRLGCGLGGLN